MTPDEIASIARQGERYLFAAEQDNNPVVRHLHFSYAAIYFEILADSATPDEIHRYGGIDIRAIRERTRREQDVSQRQLATIVGHGSGLGNWPQIVGLFGLGAAVGIVSMMALRPESERQ